MSFTQTLNGKVVRTFVQLSCGTMKTVEFREPLARDMIGLPQEINAGTIVLISRLTELTEQEVADLPLKEWARLCEILNRWIPVHRK